MNTNDDILDSYAKYLSLRAEYPEFIYHGYELQPLDGHILITYNFEIKNLAAFKPRWSFPVAAANPNILLNQTAFQNVVFYLGMVELVSYWKLTCSPTVYICGRSLNADEILWWKKLYFNGLGEFYYRNSILQNEPSLNADNMADFICKDASELPAPYNALSKQYNGALIPIGGGKDSAVSLELMRKYGKDSCCYIINPRGATLDTARIFGFDSRQTYAAGRSLDPEMLRLNREGFLNGHTPFSAIVAFSSIISAMLCEKKYIVLSNEDSANESTVQGSSVNHQYSKSFEFEQDFIEYEKKYINSGCHYFSLLRPLCELQIAKLFAEKCRKYYRIFKSCNVGSKENIWCGKCSKCLFVFIMLSPFIKQSEMSEIFGQVLTDDPEMLSDFERLIGLTAEKPFECVGSIDEIRAAVDLHISQLADAGEHMPRLYEHYIGLGLYDENKKAADKLLKHYNETNAIPKELEGIYDFLKSID